MEVQRESVGGRKRNLLLRGERVGRPGFKLRRPQILTALGAEKLGCDTNPGSGTPYRAGQKRFDSRPGAAAVPRGEDPNCTGVVQFVNDLLGQSFGKPGAGALILGREGQYGDQC